LGTLNSGSVFIGNEAGKLETSDNRLYISNSDANADNALIYGEFDNKLLRFNTDNINIRSIGDAKIILEADADNANESDNPQIEFSQDGGLVKTFLGYDQDVLGANIFGISSAKKDKILMVHEFGHVGINEYYNNTTLNVKAIATDNFVLNVEKADDANLFSVFPSGNAYLLGTLTQSSDRTLKKNIVKINNATESVQKLAGYRYNWISESSDQRTQIGVIAQELQAVYPELVSENEEGTLSVNYSGLSAVLIEAVKEQQNEIHAQEYKIDILMRKLESQALVVSELTAEMKSIRKTLGNNTVSVQSQK